MDISYVYVLQDAMLDINLVHLLCSRVGFSSLMYFRKNLQFCGRTRHGIVETADTRLCTGKIGELRTVEKMHRSSCVGVGKDPGLHSVALKVYI